MYTELLHKNIYGAEEVYGRPHLHDADVHKYDGEQRFGQVEEVFTLRRWTSMSKDFRLVLFRTLMKPPIEEHNHNVYSQHGHRQYIYCICSQNFVYMDLVHFTHVIRSAMIVVDGYWLRKAHGLLTCYNDTDNVETQFYIHFFLVKKGIILQTP